MNTTHVKGSTRTQPLVTLRSTESGFPGWMKTVWWGVSVPIGGIFKRFRRNNVGYSPETQLDILLYRVYRKVSPVTPKGWGGSGRPMVQLLQKQETFCLEYFRTGNATQSAITAGYSQHTAEVIAYENLRKPRIIERMAELNEAIATPLIADVRERKEILSTIARDKNTERTRAIDLLNKMEGAYPPQQVLALGDVTLHIKFDKEG
ncbi:hypothetical protein LCGC14_0385900 [marine sediment metagenome]|uniref:Terminase small subunit n=1 Tax=marine sediment metagenome TaxID=412755 RepID=A0A0F9VN02_9ZZZZ